MLIKEVFLYQMKHIARILIGTIFIFFIFSPNATYADELAPALNRLEVGQDQSDFACVWDAPDARLAEELEEVAQEIQVIHEDIQEQKEERQRLAAIGATIEDAAYYTPTTRAGFCAAWVSRVYANAGYGSVSGNACDMFWKWCDSTDKGDIFEGMIIAVPSHTNTSAGMVYGHVGIIVQHDDGTFWVRHSVGYMMEDPLDTWIANYGTTYQPAWGFPDGI